MNECDENQSLMSQLETFGFGVGLTASKNDDEVYVNPPPKSDARPTYYQRLKRKFISETFQCAVASVILFVSLGLIALAYVYCQPCLLGIILISACMCPFVSYCNIPLWVSILLVTILGINLVHKDFTFIWK
jgi:hypothetical protein